MYSVRPTEKKRASELVRLRSLQVYMYCCYCYVLTNQYCYELAWLQLTTNHEFSKSKTTTMMRTLFEILLYNIFLRDGWLAGCRLLPCIGRSSSGMALVLRSDGVVLPGGARRRHGAPRQEPQEMVGGAWLQRLAPERLHASRRLAAARRQQQEQQQER